MKLDNLSRPTLKVELPSDFDRLLDCGEKGAWPEASSDREIADLIGDVNKSVDKLNIRGMLQQNGSIQLCASKHDRPSLPIRHVKVEPQLLSQSLMPAGAGQTAGNAVRFHPVPPTPASVPINDNWHPLGAA